MIGEQARGTTVAIVQARMTSSRLPGKVLMPVDGEPMILQQLDRISRARCLDHIVVAVSSEASDDHLVSVLVEAGFDVVRGSLDDVLDRFVAALDSYDADVVVRLTGDCPLACPSVIDDVISAFHASTADYLSNTLDPTYPDGLDVEVMTASSLRMVARNSLDPAEREHVTLGIYRHPETFAVENFADPSGRNNSHLRWTVDNADDLDFVRWVYESMAGATFDYPALLELLKQHPDRVRTEADAKRNAALDGLDTGVMRHRDGGQG